MAQHSLNSRVDITSVIKKKTCNLLWATYRYIWHGTHVSRAGLWALVGLQNRTYTRRTMFDHPGECQRWTYSWEEIRSLIFLNREVSPRPIVRPNWVELRSSPFPSYLNYWDRFGWRETLAGSKTWRWKIIRWYSLKKKHLLLKLKNHSSCVCTYEYKQRYMYCPRIYRLFENC
jgi:hypothetical protein